MVQLGHHLVEPLVGSLDENCRNKVAFAEVLLLFGLNQLDGRYKIFV